MTAISVIHAPNDEAVGEKIAAALLREGHQAVRVSGDPMTGDLTLDGNTAIIVWSRAAEKIARIREQAQLARSRGALIPVAIGGAAPPPEFKELPPVDLSGWRGDGADPRWRFILDEVNLTQSRGLLRDGDIWAGNNAVAAAGADETAVLEKPAMAAVAEWESDSGQAARDNDNAAPFDVGSAAPDFAGAHVRQPTSFQPQQVMIAAGVTLAMLTAGLALLAPIMFSPAPELAAAPGADIDAVDVASEPLRLAFVKPVREKEPSPTETTLSTDDAPPLQSVAETVFPEKQPEISSILTEAEAEELPPAIEASIPDAAGGQGAEEGDAPMLTAPSLKTPRQGILSDGDAMENLVAAVTAEANDSEIALAKLDPPPAATEQIFLGNYFKECVACPDMAAVPAGAFLMGAPADEAGRHQSEGPVTEVRFAKGFAIGTREVTFEQWDACVAEGGCRGYAPAAAWGREKQPVVNVSFEDAQSYADWLSAKTGQNYRLPSEAEWEYAARAGAVTALAFGDRLSPNEANYAAQFPYRGPKGEPRGRPIRVASFQPNAFGLFDMHGNVWEWTADCWAPNHANAAADGAPRLGNCAARVLRGGAFNTGGWRLRSAHRISKAAGARENDNGFRVARDLD